MSRTNGTKENRRPGPTLNSPRGDLSSQSANSGDWSPASKSDVVGITISAPPLDMRNSRPNALRDFATYGEAIRTLLSGSMNCLDSNSSFRSAPSRGPEMAGYAVPGLNTSSRAPDLSHQDEARRPKMYDPYRCRLRARDLPRCTSPKCSVSSSPYDMRANRNGSPTSWAR